MARFFFIRLSQNNGINQFIEGSVLVRKDVII